MSYEGCTQYLCTKGHAYTVDSAYETYTAQDNNCPFCGDEKRVWHNSVDQTNNSPPLFTAFRIKEQQVVDNCGECGKPKAVLSEATYHIPTQEEMEAYYKKVEEYYTDLGY